MDYLDDIHSDRVTHRIAQAQKQGIAIFIVSGGF
jgi:LAS superfamily LD-carboxypeptidase LdcB